MNFQHVDNERAWEWENGSKPDPPDKKGHQWRMTVVRDVDDRGRTVIYRERRCARCNLRAPDVRERPTCDERLCEFVHNS